MNKSFTLALAIAATFGQGTFAQESAIDPAATVVKAKVELVASPELVARFQSICNANFVLSDKAKTACETNAVPKPNKAQTMFRNTGIGVEFNTLARQMTGE